MRTSILILFTILLYFSCKKQSEVDEAFNCNSSTFKNLEEVDKALKQDYVDCFGGVDDSHYSFTNFQKAVNFTMTSLITTAGVRGGRSKYKNFE